MKLINKDYAVDTAWSIEVYHGSAREVCEMLEDAPTVDAEPVRHGKWLSREEGCLYPFWERYTCSECGKHADDTKYCPNCGAKMDAERKEHETD